MAARSRFKSLLGRLHRPVYDRRLAALTKLICDSLRKSDRVLDVGCGTGELGNVILRSNECPKDVSVEGVEIRRRGGEFICVTEYDGRSLPFEDNSFDVVILADVLHHTADVHRLIEECARVSRRDIVIKDHKLDGPLAKARLSLIDWAANAPYDVPVLFRYNTHSEWRIWFSRHRLKIRMERSSVKLYPFAIEWLFGGRLQYFAILRAPE